jgi:hypothetical protein
MEKQLKLDLIQRSLGLRHKLKVHDSMKQPETHEDMAVMFLSKWEYEDELTAIEQILADVRQKNIEAKRARLLKHGVTKDSKLAVSPEGYPVDDEESPSSSKKKSKK